MAPTNPLNICPVRLEPVFTARPWGSRSLAPLFPEKSSLAEPIGEAWMSGANSRFAGGPFAGRTLGDVWPEMTPEWTGTRVKHQPLFPLLVKFIFAEEKLSVQVHPDDIYAARHEQAAGGRGKTEMWYILHATPGATVLAGLKHRVTRASLERAIADGTAEDLLHSIPLRAGDAVFIPAGTVHTIGPGLVLCEIQQNSDITYRLYDYNRRDAHGHGRELHVAKGLEVTNFGEQRGGKLDPAPPLVPAATSVVGGAVESVSPEETHLVACGHFAVERWKFTAGISVKSSPEYFDLLIFLEGKGMIAWGAESLGYAPAQVWLIPAALGEYRLAPSEPTSLLRTYVPPSLDELSADLSHRGVSAAHAQRIIHR